ncbi:Hypothetical protein FKW44_013791, partial [Caligus rogercresseyi]
SQCSPLPNSSKSSNVSSTNGGDSSTASSHCKSESEVPSNTIDEEEVSTKCKVDPKKTKLNSDVILLART